MLKQITLAFAVLALYVLVTSTLHRPTAEIAESAIFQARAQDGASVNQSFGPPVVPYQTNYYYSGTNLTYMCIARSNQTENFWPAITVTTASNANPVSFTATGHGFEYQSATGPLPVVKITGATGGWTGINGVWVATPTSANAFTIPVDSTAFGAYGAQAPTYTTTSPRTNLQQWAIRRMTYDASNNLIFSGWAVKVGAASSTNMLSGNTAMNKRCDERTNSAMAYQ